MTVFEAGLPHQNEAVAAVADAIADSVRDPYLRGSNPRVGLDHGLLENIRRIQRSGDLPESVELFTLTSSGDVTAAAETEDVGCANLAVEMETGTGKTYVAIKTACTLHARYGFEKFIVIVPSIAIRIGFSQQLEDLRAHMLEETGSDYTVVTYDSQANASVIRDFASDPGMRFLVLTLDSLNKDTNRLRTEWDSLSGQIPLDLIAQTSPVLIIDEPQNFESQLSRRTLAILHPGLVLRYSATHREQYNLLYRLDPAAAHAQGLVKSLVVAPVTTTRASIRLDDIVLAGRAPRAHFTRTVPKADGTSDRIASPAAVGALLQAADQRWRVESIDRGTRTVRLDSGIEERTLHVGETLGEDPATAVEAQLRVLLREHFARQVLAAKRDVKVLSLIFLDRVASWVSEEGVVRSALARAWAAEAPRAEGTIAGRPWGAWGLEDVTSAYFALKTKRGQGAVATDPSETDEKDTDRLREAYALIMRDKQRLCSLDCPVSIIISHSALREGWDNPNVFTIATFNEAKSDIRRRQELGRGLRLPVDQHGKRVRDEKLNELTVITTADYRAYAASYQRELEAAWGTESGVLPRKRGESAAGLRAQVTAKALDPRFALLWQHVSRRTRYEVVVDSDRVASHAADLLRQTDVGEEIYVTTKSRLRLNGTTMVEAQDPVHQRIVTRDGGEQGAPEGIVQLVQTRLRKAETPVLLTRRTIATALQEAGDDFLALATTARSRLVDHATRALRAAAEDVLVNGVRYIETGDAFRLELLGCAAGDELWRYNPQRAEDSPTAVYTPTEVDSQVERSFVQGLERRSQDGVATYMKLPRTFWVETPLGKYHPDWAIVFEGSEGTTLYLVRETKSSHFLEDHRRREELKVLCGAAHFDALGVNYRVVTSPEQLPDGGTNPQRSKRKPATSE